MIAITNVKDSLQHFQVLASGRVDDPERTADPRNTEKHQHGKRAAQTRPVTAFTADSFCRNQRIQLNEKLMLFLNDRSAMDLQPH